MKYIYSYFELTLNYQNKYPAITHPYSLLYSPDWGLPELLMPSFEKVMEARLSISGEDGKREIVYKGMLQPEAYRGFTSSADYLFFLYTGKEVPLDNQKDFKSYILCFD